jgi:hypothetical protein
MADQLAHLLNVIRLPSLALGIIPFTTDRHDMWPLEPFYVYDDEAVIVETLTAEIRITESAEIGTYLRAYRALGQLAVYGPPTAELIQGALDALR